METKIENEKKEYELQIKELKEKSSNVPYQMSYMSFNSKIHKL